MAEQSEAQQRRAEARERRRGQSKTKQDDTTDAPVADDNDGDGEQPLDAVKHAAKIAAAGAAVGAAAAAARALTSRGDDDQMSKAEDDAESGVDDRQLHEPDRPESDDQERAEPNSSESQGGEDEHAASVTEHEEERPVTPQHRLEEDDVRGATPEDAGATVQRAREQLEALLERPVESVSSFARTHSGWLVTLEVVEVTRIPESTDVIASYELELDEDRNLRRYARVQRYYRSQADRREQ